MRQPHRLNRRPEERVRVLGGVVDLVRPEEVFHFIDRRVSAKRKAIVANHNLHSLYLIRKNSQIAKLFEIADLIEVDSLPLILWARLIGRPSRRFHRCTYLDWRDDFWRIAVEKGWRVFFVGGEPGVAEKARAAIQTAWPQARLETHHGFFDPSVQSAENRAVVEQIRAFQADIVLVGMGMPRQETWVLDNYDALPPSVVLTVGGAFDYEAGVQVVCPRWIGTLGLEWLFRLASNPSRLFTRYCIEPWHLILPAMQDLLTLLTRPGPSKREAASRRN